MVTQDHSVTHNVVTKGKSFFETDTLCKTACLSELRTAVAAPCQLQLCVVLVTQLSTKDVTLL